MLLRNTCSTFESFFVSPCVFSVVALVIFGDALYACCEVRRKLHSIVAREKRPESEACFWMDLRGERRGPAREPPPRGRGALPQPRGPRGARADARPCRATTPPSADGVFRRLWLFHVVVFCSAFLVVPVLTWSVFLAFLGRSAVFCRC